MFNSTTFNSPKSVDVTITENKAPTDDSIRLYGELRDKAIASIINIGDSNFSVDKITWVVMDAPEIDGIILYLTFFVNEKECKETMYITTRDLYGVNKENRCELIVNKVRILVRRRVSEEITALLFRSMAARICTLLKI